MHMHCVSSVWLGAGRGALPTRFGSPCGLVPSQRSPSHAKMQVANGHGFYKALVCPRLATYSRSQ